MFNQTQIESYKNIAAPADLRERVFEACMDTKEKNSHIPVKTIYRLVPMAACLVLCFSLFSFAFQGERQAFYLNMGEITLDSATTELPPLAQEATAWVRTISLEPSPYTIALKTNPDVEILSADGDAWLDKDGNLTWTVLIPENDAVFELTLQAGGETYLVPLTYHLQDGSITISCQKQ